MARTGIGNVKIPGIVKLLFETPSGFAIFSFVERYLKKDIEHIWIYFVGNYWHKNVVWLDEFLAFDDKPNVINLTAQTINASLIQMLWRHCRSDDTLVVGSHAYKDLIEQNLGLKCRYDDAVDEVMWGLQNLMQILVPEEQSEVTKDDRLPMSIGLNMVLTRHEIYIKHQMLNESIIKKIAKVYEADLCEKAHSKFLHKRFDEDFKKNFSVDSRSWSLIQLVIALKIIIDPRGVLEVGNPHEMFSPAELASITSDAHLYGQTVHKDYILALYNDVVTLQEDKAELLNELRSLVEVAKAALETEELQEKPATNDVDSKKQVDVSIDEGHCCITGAVGEDILPPSNSADPGLLVTSTNHSMQEGDLHTSSIFSVAPEVVPRSTLPASQEINALSTGVNGKMHEKETANTSVEQVNAVSDEDNVKNHTIEGKNQVPEIIAEGRKWTEGIKSVDNLEEKEQPGNSIEKQMNSILDGVGNGRTAVGTAIREEKHPCGNASAKNKTLNPGTVEVQQTEVSKSADYLEENTESENSSEEQMNVNLNGVGNDRTAVEKAIPKEEKRFRNASVEQNGAHRIEGERTEDTQCEQGHEGLEEKELSENSCEKQMNAILDGIGNDRTAVEKAIPEEEKRCGNASVEQNGAHRIEGVQTEDTQSEQEHVGKQSVDNLKEKDQPVNNSEKQKNAILVGVGNDRTAVETSILEKMKQGGNASVKQKGAHRGEERAEGSNRSEGNEDIAVLRLSSEKTHVSFGELISFTLPISSSEVSGSGAAKVSGSGADDTSDDDKKVSGSGANDTSDDGKKVGKRQLALFSWFRCFRSSYLYKKLTASACTGASTSSWYCSTLQCARCRIFFSPRKVPVVSRYTWNW